MKYRDFIRVVIVILIASSVGLAQTAAEVVARVTADLDSSTASDAVKAYVKDNLIPLCTNSVLVAETKSQNARNISLSEIQSIDQQWQVAEEEMPIMEEKLTNACAEELNRIANALPAIREVFVMDNQGAIVGESNLTSDYWQGDEAKWINSYKDGQGGCDVGQEKFDRSTNAVIQQVSLPVVDSDGTVVGAITIGLSTGSMQ
jgi:hypothetical protein